MNKDFLLQLSGVESAHEHAQGRRGRCLSIVVPECGDRPTVAVLTSCSSEPHHHLREGAGGQGVLTLPLVSATRVHSVSLVVSLLVCEMKVLIVSVSTVESLRLCLHKAVEAGRGWFCHVVFSVAVHWVGLRPRTWKLPASCATFEQPQTGG